MEKKNLFHVPPEMGKKINKYTERIKQYSVRNLIQFKIYFSFLKNNYAINIK